MLRSYLVLTFYLSALSAFSQTMTIKGRVCDSSTNNPLAYATISLVSARDTTLISFVIADSAGQFLLKKPGPGDYLLSASYAGYLPAWRPLPYLSGDGIHETADIHLVPVTNLRDVRVTARRPPVEINNDTIEFNSENFRTQPNAVVEDMLKKMPGVTVESDGTIKVNGQTVRRILVNGKEFFTGDVKMATKNLNADAVDKVQVFDRKSDQAAFTGVDDGNGEKTINLKLKKDRNFATFGKITAGGGSGSGGGRYDAQTNINKFKGDEQLSFLGMANNTNRQGFSLMDVLNFTGELSRGMRNGGGRINIQSGNAGSNNGLPVTGLGQNQQGVARTSAGGLNYNNSWDSGKGSLNSNYTVSNIRLVTNKTSLSQNLAPGNNYTTQDTTGTVYEVTQHRLAAILDQQLGSSTSFRLTPSMTWQHSGKNAADRYASQTSDGQLLNDGFSDNGTNPSAFDFSTELLLRHRLAKKGRTISGDFNIAYNHSRQDGSQISDNQYYRGTDSLIDQITGRDATTRTLGGNITYTEPIGRRSLLALSSFLNVNTGASNKQTFDYNPGSGKHDMPNSLLSNDFGSEYRYSGGGISFRSNQKKLNITVGANIQSASLNATNHSSGSYIRQSFTDLLPNAIFQYNFSQTRNLRFDYSTYTTQPSVTQLQPVPDISNPLNTTTGNPTLKRSYTHSVSLNYFSASPTRGRHLLFFFNATDALDAIVQSDSVSSVGTRTSRPVNTNGTGNLLTNLEYGFPIRALHARLELGSFFIYSLNKAFVNGAANRITSTTLRPNLSFDYDIADKFDLELTASVSFYTGTYSLQPALNTHYLRHNYGATTTNYLPLGFSLHNEFSYILNTGRSDGYNTNIPLWNISLARPFLKNDRAEIKLGVMDLLDRNNGITRSINQGNILDERYNVLHRYFLLSLTYSLNKAGLRTKGGPNIKIRSFDR
ncbi:MAG: TonB-dependent receptor [Bacteroidetes bacterium]|nr:TonB-dependent receptor [Bacteroidota bacterium]